MKMVAENLYTLGKIVNDRCEYKEMAAINPTYTNKFNHTIVRYSCVMLDIFVRVVWDHFNFQYEHKQFSSKESWCCDTFDDARNPKIGIIDLIK